MPRCRRCTVQRSSRRTARAGPRTVERTPRALAARGPSSVARGPGAPLLVRVEANPLRAQAREPARHRRCHDIERPDRRAGDRRGGGDRRGLVSAAQTGDREHEYKGHESESLDHASTSSSLSLGLVLDLGPTTPSAATPRHSEFIDVFQPANRILFPLRGRM